MSVSIYFGLPGSGKTTFAVKHIYKYVKKGYKVYTNIDVSIPRVIKITEQDFGKFDISDGIVIFDEATQAFDNRDWKSFSNDMRYFFLMHRHYNIKLVELFTQKFDGVDVKIRNLTDHVYWVRKLPFRRNVSKAISVPYGLYIPDKNDVSHVGEIISGYYKPSIWQRLFSEKCYRPRFYKYFDTYERKYLPPLPDDRVNHIDA